MMTLKSSVAASGRFIADCAATAIPAHENFQSAIFRGRLSASCSVLLLRGDDGVRLKKS